MLATESPILLPFVHPKTPPNVRVLHVVNGEHYSGAERVQDLLALRLPEFGVEVGFAALKSGKFASVRESQATPLFELPMRSRWDWSVARRLTKLCATIITTCSTHTPRVGRWWLRSLPSGLALHWCITSIAQPHDSTHRIQNWINGQLERWTLRQSEQLIAVSPSLRQAMIDAGFPADRVTCICNGVPASKLNPKRRPAGVWTLAMIALFRPRKGMEVLLQSLSILRTADCSVKLCAIGGFETPEYEREIRQLAHQLGVAEMIEWTGFTNDVTRELAKADLLVLPSLFGEGLPMVVLEAMAAGIPVVATDVEGVREAVIDGVTGRLVKPGDANEFAAAIDSIARGNANYEALAQAAQFRHAERFSDRAMAEQVACVYREVVRDAARRS